MGLWKKLPKIWPNPKTFTAEKSSPKFGLLVKSSVKQHKAKLSFNRRKITQSSHPALFAHIHLNALFQVWSLEWAIAEKVQLFFTNDVCTQSCTADSFTTLDLFGRTFLQFLSHLTSGMHPANLCRYIHTMYIHMNIHTTHICKYTLYTYIHMNIHTTYVHMNIHTTYLCICVHTTYTLHTNYICMSIYVHDIVLFGEIILKHGKNGL
jgi:hypothetical protein